MGKLKNLRFLDLRANRLTVLPESLSKLRKLEKLDLRWNQFRDVPTGIPQLERRNCIVYI
jgi:Leucine-rich repeat (LRR) protein